MSYTPGSIHEILVRKDPAFARKLDEVEAVITAQGGRYGEDEIRRLLDEALAPELACHPAYPHRARHRVLVANYC